MKNPGGDRSPARPPRERPAGRDRSRATAPRSSGAASGTPWTAATLGELSAFFGTALGTIKKWREQGLPGTQGAWDLAACIQWVRARDRRLHRQASRKDPGRRLKEIRAALLRERLLEVRRVTMPVEDHQRYTSRLCGLFKGTLLALARSLGSDLEGLPAAERDRVIQERCHELLEDLAGDSTTEGS